jgi:hypothetical protein
VRHHRHVRAREPWLVPLLLLSLLGAAAGWPFYLLWRPLGYAVCAVVMLAVGVPVAVARGLRDSRRGGAGASAVAVVRSRRGEGEATDHAASRDATPADPRRDARDAQACR